MVRAVASSASRYSAKLSHCQSMPSCSAVPGMSSTPSMSSMRKPSLPGRTGAKPTPQLPITTVVTPCQLDGVMLRVPDDLAVVVRVDVDPARGDDEPVGVDLPGAASADAADLGDHAAVDGDVGGDRRRPRAVDDRAPSDDELVHDCPPAALRRTARPYRRNPFLDHAVK